MEEQGHNETIATTIVASGAGTSRYTIRAGRESAITTRVAHNVVSKELFIGQFQRRWEVKKVKNVEIVWSDDDIAMKWRHSSNPKIGLCAEVAVLDGTDYVTIR